MTGTRRIDLSIAGELALLDPKIRGDAVAIDLLLHADFSERGQSGRWWTRASVVGTLPGEAQAFVSPTVRDLVGVELSEGVVLVTYVSESGGNPVGRSSVWLETDGRMQLRWHQGTPLSKPEVEKAVKRPDECADLADVRAEIDRIDREVVRLLGERFGYVLAAAPFKKTAAEVAAPDRFAKMLAVRRDWATDEGLDPNVIERLYRDLVTHFIEAETQHWARGSGFTDH